MTSKFIRMGKNDRLVQELSSGKYLWWNRIVELANADKHIHVQVRPSSLNVYCKMGSLFQITFKNGKVICKIHYKYLLNERKPEYIDIKSDYDRVVNDNHLPHIAGDLLQARNIDLLKKNIGRYVGEEKTIQSKLVEHNKNTILDAEVAFSEKAMDEKNDTRIDLVNYDKKSKKIVFVELKQIFDKRLYDGKINHQLKSYRRFVRNNKADIIRAYNNVIEAKKELGLIGVKSPLFNAKINDVEERVLLVIAGYNQAFIDVLRTYFEENQFFEAISTDALGLYMFGSAVDLNISGHSSNKYLFD